MGHSGLLEYQRGVLLFLKARQEAQDSSVQPGGNDPGRIALDGTRRIRRKQLLAHNLAGRAIDEDNRAVNSKGVGSCGVA
jgi:hypothetical protein